MILAYIDPGAGSLVLQALLAGMLTLPFIFRSFVVRGWRRLRGVGRQRDADNSAPLDR